MKKTENKAKHLYEGLKSYKNRYSGVEDEPIVDIDESQEQSEQTEPNENQVSLDETPLQESDQPAEVDTEQQQFEKDE